MATPETQPEVVGTAVEVTKAANIVQHVKENNIAYLIGILVSYQMGILQNVYAYGTGICI